MTNQGLDLRLVPAALASWGVAFAAVGDVAAAAARLAVVATVGVGLLGLVVPRVGRCVRAARARRRNPGVAGRRPPARPPSAPAPTGGSLRLTVVLALVAAGSTATSAAAHLHARERGALDELVVERAAVVVVGTVRSEPVAVPDPWGSPAGASGASGPGAPEGSASARHRVVLRVHEVTGRGRTTAERAEVVVLGGPQWSRAAYGQTVRARGRLAPVGRGDRALGLFLSGSVEVVGPAPWVDRQVTSVREALLDVTDDFSPDARGLVPGAAIGDTRRVPEDLDQAMRDTGLTHITAVSGGHFAVLVVTVLTVGAVLRLPRAARALGCAVVMTGFVLLVHPEPSVVRAAAMGAVMVGGLLARRSSRPVAALGAAVVVLLVLDPWLSRSYGFVLSVLATAAIVLLAPPLSRVLEVVLPRPVSLVVAVPVAAQAACGPVLVLLDPVVAVYAVPANVLAAPALLPATLLGAAATVTASWAPALATGLAHGAAVATWWIAAVARGLAGLPGARLPWPGGAGGALLLAALTAVGLVAVLAAPRLGPRRRRVLAGAALCVVLVVGPVGEHVRGWVPGSGPPRDWQVVACDVGQGDALLLRSGPSSAVMVDVGPDDSAVRCLDEHGVRSLDLLVLTHPHADHVRGLDAVLARQPVALALVSPADEGASETASALARAGVPVATGMAATPGDDGSGAAGAAGRSPGDQAGGPTGRARPVLSAGTSGTVAWQVVGPSSDAGGLTAADSSAVNDASVVLLLDVGGLTVLALGDVEPAGQERLLERLRSVAGPRPVDVVKVAHHGSAHQSPELAQWLAPTLALISAGAGNDYGHPAPETVELYRGAGAAVMSTHECGRIAVARVRAGLELHADCPSVTAGTAGGP